MLNYRPLETKDSEIRVLSLQKRNSQDLIECTLEHVSLDDYTQEYRDFLRLDGASASIIDRAILWEFVTNKNLEFRQKRDNQPPDSLIRKTFAHFSGDPLYREARFMHAKRYAWGDYSALSYEWGDASVRTEMIVNGVKISVTKNLEAALRDISDWWHGEHRDGSMRLWVDALCINQQDIPERNLQVKRMRHLYSHAFCVIAWTGPALNVGHEATSHLLNWIIHTTFDTDTSFEEGAMSLMTPENREAWKGLIMLAGRTYWQRMWIIQEVILANTGARLCFGTKVCLVSHYFKAMVALMQNFSYIQSLDNPEEGRAENSYLTKSLLDLDRCERFIRLDLFKQNCLSHPPLITLLDTGRKAQQSDKRDKVYSLLGLVDSRISDSVVPNYNKPYLEVYLDFALSIIKSTGRLELVLQGALNSGESTQALPSWAPDWSIDNSSNPDILSMGHYQDMYYKNFRAAKDTLHQFRDSGDKSILLCRGFVFDTVDGLVCSGPTNEPHDHHDVVYATAERVRHDGEYDDGVLRNAFWDTCTLGYQFCSDSAKEFLNGLPYFKERAESIPFFHVVDRFQQCNSQLAIGRESLSSLFPRWKKRFKELPEDDDVLSALRFIMLTLIFKRFLTTKGGHMALGPKQAQKGDGIFVIQGCNVPLVLRKNLDDNFRVIGECYVHGIMNGEAMEMFAVNGAQEMDIRLS